MKDRIFQLSVNGKILSRVSGAPNTQRAEFIKYVKGIQEFDETRDILEVTDITPPDAHKVLRHPACDKSTNNKLVDVILSRQVLNLINTYGEDRLFKVLADVHGLVKTETKAS